MKTRQRISQREAHKLRRRVVVLEEQIGRICSRAASEYAWPSGRYIADEPNATDKARTAIDVARRLGHPVFCDVQDTRIRLFAAKVD